MSLAEFLERLEADPFDPKLVELVKDGFNIVSENQNRRRKINATLEMQGGTTSRGDRRRILDIHADAWKTFLRLRP